MKRFIESTLRVEASAEFERPSAEPPELPSSGGAVTVEPELALVEVDVADFKAEVVEDIVCVPEAVAFELFVESLKACCGSSFELMLTSSGSDPGPETPLIVKSAVKTVCLGCFEIMRIVLMDMRSDPPS